VSGLVTKEEQNFFFFNAIINFLNLFQFLLTVVIFYSVSFHLLINAFGHILFSKEGNKLSGLKTSLNESQTQEISI